MQISSPSPHHTLPQLFARYLAGQIADRQWDDFASAYDAAEVDAAGRAALAAFCSDALAEMGGAARMPSPQDVRDFLPMLNARA